MRSKAIVCSIALLAVALTLPLVAQPAKRSPAGSAATQVGEGYSKWVTVDYSRPILRGRAGIFGSGEEYGKKVYAGAPVWRAGADVSTRLKTEVDLKFGDTTVPAGEYSLFIDLGGPTNWTLLISKQPAMASFNRDKVGAETWGAYGYDEKQVVAKVPMQVDALEPVMDQLTWLFSNVSESGGTLVIAWDQTVAAAPFTVP